MGRLLKDAAHNETNPIKKKLLQKIAAQQQNLTDIAEAENKKAEAEDGLRKLMAATGGISKKLLEEQRMALVNATQALNKTVKEERPKELDLDGRSEVAVLHPDEGGPKSGVEVVKHFKKRDMGEMVNVSVTKVDTSLPAKPPVKKVVAPKKAPCVGCKVVNKTTLAAKLALTKTTNMAVKQMQAVTNHALEAVGHMFDNAETGLDSRWDETGMAETGASETGTIGGVIALGSDETGASEATRSTASTASTGASGSTGSGTRLTGASGSTGSGTGMTGASGSTSTGSATGPSKLDVALEKATKTSRGSVRRAAGMDILKNIHTAAEAEATSAEAELDAVLLKEKKARDTKAAAAQGRIVKNLLALKKVQVAQAALEKAKLANATTVAKRIEVLDNSLKQQVSDGEKSLAFAKEKGQSVGQEDARIIELLKEREGNASRVLVVAERAANKSGTGYIVATKAVNVTEKELEALLGVDGTGGTGFSGSTGISGATGGADEVRGPTGVHESGATSSAGVQESATGSMSGASGATAASGGTGATGNDIPDNIAPTGVIEATA